MRPFRSEDEGLLFGVAKLAFADCDDGRTSRRSSGIPSSLRSWRGSRPATSRWRNPLRRSASNSSVCIRPTRRKASTSSCSTGPRATRSRRLGPARGRGRRRERPRRRVLPQPRVRPGRAGSPRARPAAGLCSLAVVLAALALPAAASAHARLVGLEARRRRRARDRAATTSRSSSTTRSARPGATGSSTRGAARCSPARRTGWPATTALARAAAAPGLAARRLQRPLAGRLERRPPGLRRARVRRRRGLGRGRCSILSAGGGTSIASVLLRFLFLAGVLVAGGAALTGRVLLEPGRRRLETAVVGAGLVLVAAGGLRPAGDRAGRRRDAVRPGDRDRGDRRSGRRRGRARVDRGPDCSPSSPPGRRARPRRADAGRATRSTPAPPARWSRSPTSSTSRLRRSGSAGCRCSCSSGSPRARRRFPPIALGAVAVLGGGVDPPRDRRVPVARLGRHTGYGQTVLVKTGVLVAVLAVAWVNRHRIARARPRRRARAARRPWSSRSRCSPTCGRRRVPRPPPAAVPAVPRAAARRRGRARRARTTTSPSGSPPRLAGGTSRCASPRSAPTARASTG